MNAVEHIFQCIAEEASEITQAAMKITRFSLSGNYPDGTGNLEMLTNEIYDLLGAIELLQDSGISLQIPTHLINFDSDLKGRWRIDAKKAKIKKHMKYAVKMGSLDLTKSEIYQEEGHYNEKNI
jgi:hypothetical protein